MALSPADFDQLMVPVLDLYDRFFQSVLNDIARRLAGLSGIAPASAAWQVQRLAQSGLTYTEIITKVGQLTNISRSELRKMFKLAGVKTTTFDAVLYRAAGLHPIPLNLSPAMNTVLEVGLRKTSEYLENLVLTTALTGQEAFIDAVDVAYLNVVSGTMSYDQAIRAAIKEMARKGITTVGFKGRRDQADVAVRRAVLTGVAETAGAIQIQNATEMGVDLVQTSAHIGPRPTHEPWQGRVFSISGTSSKYPSFVETTGYGEVDGLSGINCRHSFYPFFEGISVNAYTKETLDEYKNAVVIYNGKRYSVYEANQIQRAMERKIRALKREAGALGAAGFDNQEEIADIRETQAQLRSFVDQTGLIRQPWREGPRAPKKVVAPIPSAAGL